MIYTLTTNPAIDMNISSDEIHKNVVNRTVDAYYSPNGKGVNVSYVLQYFDVNSVVMGFFGGFSGRYVLDDLHSKGFTTKVVEVEEPTRINVFLHDGKDEYKFVNEGSFVSETQQQQLLNKIRETKDMEYLVVSGSLSKGMDDTFYDELIQIATEKETKVIFDISSTKLEELLVHRPYLIKPNDDEVKAIFGKEVRTEQEIVETLLYLHQAGAQHILLTLGERGAYFYNGVSVYRASAVEIELLSSACAGDATLGAFLSVWLADTNAVERALIRASAVGANVAESSGLGDFANVDTYMKEIRVTKIV